MTILFHCTFNNSKEWKRKIKKKFKNKNIISIYEKNKFKNVDIAIIWNLPNQILNNLPNLKIQKNGKEKLKKNLKKNVLFQFMIKINLMKLTLPLYGIYQITL